MTRYDGPKDTKVSRTTMLAGAILIAAGMFVAVYGIYSVVRSALDGASAFGLIGGIMFMPIGLILIMVGGAIVFFGSVNRLFFDRNKRPRY